jgi:Leucine-rich repeat (LRR) protein
LDANKLKILETNALADLMTVIDPSVLLLSNQNIQEIQPFAFIGLNKIPSLTLASNSLKSLINHSFYGMSKLTRLDLSKNNIDFIELDAFIGLTSLMLLDLSLNLLNSTPPWPVLSNLANLKSYILYDNEINFIQRDSLQVVGENLLNLYLANNKLQFVKNNYFSNLSKVEFLDLKSNSISTIESKSFIALIKLKQLLLSENCIFKISPLLFRNQIFLNELLLDSNLLTNIENVFSSLSSLKTLNLGYNSIYQLSNQTFKGLNSLNSINLSSNFIKSLNKSLIPLKSIQSIDLTNNRVLIGQDQIHTVSNANIYDYYFHNTSIELINYVIRNVRISKLDLSFNDLAKNGLIYNIPFRKMSAYLIRLDLRRTGLNGYAVDSLNVLNMLSYVDLSDNSIILNGTFLFDSSYLNSIKLSNINMSQSDFETYIDLSLFRFLRVVDLSLNGLEVIKLSYFKKSLTLSFLNLSHNKIKSIETLAFKPNDGLMFLDLTSNQLISISDILASIQSVKLLAANNKIQDSEIKLDARPEVPMVNVSGNELKEIPSQISTMILDTSANLATSIAKATFIKMSKLVELYISSNLIETIEENSFLKLTRLTTLDLSNNRLKILGNDTFCGLFSVSYLNLNQNSLEVIQKSLFRQLVTLDQLLLSSNPIKLIEDESFLNQNFLKLLNLDSYNPYNENGSLTMTNITFAGLVNVRVLVLENEVLSSLTNVNNLFAYLKPIYSNQGFEKIYYRSRNVIYAKPNYTDWDCLLVLYSIRSQIQVNLNDDAALEVFLDYCGQYSLTQLEYIIESGLV